MPIRPPDRLIARLLVAGVLLGSLASCARRGACTGDYCGTVVIAAAGEPDILLPPVAELSTSRGVYDQLFLKLADLGMSGNTIGDEDFQPQLAERWEWNGPVTLVFHLDPRARWQDGRVVTAGDVVFTYDAYTDSLVNSPFRSSLRLISAVAARDSLTAVVRFRNRYPYKGAAYGYLGFNLATPGDSTKPHPLFGDRELRRALVMAVDRTRLLRNVFGDFAKVPPGPISQLAWIWDPETRELPHDSAQAARLLTRLGWIDSDSDGVRDRAGQKLAFRILVPTTSASRRLYARLLQETFRTIGADVQLDEVDLGLFSERARTGRFDAVLYTWNTDPTPSSSIPQTWTQAGLGRSNHGRYVNPAFDRLADRAVGAMNRAEARRLWRTAIEVLNQDAPAIFLFAPDAVAAAHRRITDVTIRPDSWRPLLRTWRIPGDRLTDRDRAER